jgi:3-hydroxyisobutyryl-CoA hydrolase
MSSAVSSRLSCLQYCSIKRSFSTAAAASQHKKNELPHLTNICARDRVTGLYPHEVGGHEKDEVITSSTSHYRSLILNRPKALNALNLNMVNNISARLKLWDRSREVGVTVIRGVGPKAFCAGGDILALCNDKWNSAQGDSKDDGRQDSKLYKKGQLAQTFFQEEYRLNLLTSMLRKPYIPWLNGITMGGGVGLSVHSRLRFSTEKSVFAMPETAIGFFPDVGGSHFLPRLDGQLGMYLALTGARLKGADLFHAGITTNHAFDDRFEVFQSMLDDSMCFPETVERAIESVSELPSDLAPFSLEPHLDTIDYCFAKDSVEQIMEALQKHVSQGKDAAFCTKTLQTLKEMSPTSLKITFLQQRKGAEKNLKNCLKMDYRIAMHIVNNLKSDFYTGVNNMLVLKDRNNKPQWNPPTLQEVSDKYVESHFKEHEYMDDLDLTGVDNVEEIVHPPKQAEF